jgi:hypothetical protein
MTGSTVTDLFGGTEVLNSGLRCKAGALPLESHFQTSGLYFSIF